MDLTIEQLKLLLPNNAHIEQWHKSLSKILPLYGIDTQKRIAAFISQCAHESADFKVLRENLNYRPTTLRKTFSKYFSTDSLAIEYCSKPNKQAAIANRVYANRMGNGDEYSGDGYRYCGRGLIQLTGKENYSKFAKSLSISTDDALSYITTFDGAVHSACWFWKTFSLNEYADNGDVASMTKLINGGNNGLSDRILRYKYALSVLGKPT